MWLLLNWGPNAWMILICFTYLCAYIGGLWLGLDYFFSTTPQGLEAVVYISHKDWGPNIYLIKCLPL